MAPPLFLVDAMPSGVTATLDGDEARHASTVLRLKPGEVLQLSDGAGAAARCAVDEVRPGREPELQLSVVERWTVPQPEPLVTVVQALAKGDRGELAVELATEAGADAVVPWRAARSVARWEDGPRGAKALQRWRASARAATKQARRAWLPPVREAVSTPELLELVRAAAATVVLDGDAAGGIADVEWPAAGEVLLVVGPEGGMTDDERDGLLAAGAQAARLGPSVLRTSTAAAVALGSIGVLTRRWT